MIVMRYGKEVNGGAELLCRMVAEKMQKHWDIEVLTTCAVDYVTWKNEYPAGDVVINGVNVKRFPVDGERPGSAFNRTYDMLAERRIWKNPHFPKIVRRLTRFLFNRPLFRRLLELRWMRQQGPNSSALTRHLRQHQAEYDACIFYTYSYGTTFNNLPIVRDKAFVLPATHDEPCLYFGIFDQIFRDCRGLIYSTPEEKTLLERRFPAVAAKRTCIAGIGVELRPPGDPEAFRTKFNITGKYIVYVGRIEPLKGCLNLFEFFLKYVADVKSPLQLVMMGKASMEIPAHPQIKSLGFVSEDDKFNGMSGAECLVMPSTYESLSIALLEAWMSDIPVLVTGGSPVLKAQTERARGGLWFISYDEFKTALTTLVTDRTQAKTMAAFGRRYTEKTYTWSKIEQDYLDLISNKQ